MMGYWPMMWWPLIPLALFFLALGTLGARRYCGWSGRWTRTGERRRVRRSREEERDDVAEGRRQQIEQLESRVAELESRLDFAERLLAKRHESQELSSRDPT